MRIHYTTHQRSEEHSSSYTPGYARLDPAGGKQPTAAISPGCDSLLRVLRATPGCDIADRVGIVPRERLVEALRGPIPSFFGSPSAPRAFCQGLAVIFPRDASRPENLCRLINKSEEQDN
ncbi:hypothetical protein PRIPAC_93908 [Pristionchus pacificus]|uniref:Uncharacterized protein n=1 Tax=Pristionchus pacificus TaxID=54126 RepID=A0A2A6CCQ3_PRIPA|nr:hypothetical protein PRIPAC_93908 [Pristionchus pacificus]|eukprot:PDM76015.1 hypothetical protein PRIPAC_39619 [Pristionchus pacificus]